jgi:hypothetical protein
MHEKKGRRKLELEGVRMMRRRRKYKKRSGKT